MGSKLSDERDGLPSTAGRIFSLYATLIHSLHDVGVTGGLVLAKHVSNHGIFAASGYHAPRLGVVQDF